MEEKNKKYIAFTFDDGPSMSSSTLDILDVLKQYSIQATFFVLGYNVSKKTEILNKILEEKCEIGNHSWNHEYLWKVSDEEVLSSIKKTQAIIEENTGIRPNLFRAPYGNFDFRIMNILKKMQFYSSAWSLDSRDWESRDKDCITKKVLEEVKDGSIIIMHDIYDTTYLAVKELIPKLLKENYNIVTVSKLLELNKIKMEYNRVYYSGEFSKEIYE